MYESISCQWNIQRPKSKLTVQPSLHHKWNFNDLIIILKSTLQDSATICSQGNLQLNTDTRKYPSKHIRLNQYGINVFNVKRSMPAEMQHQQKRIYL